MKGTLTVGLLNHSFCSSNLGVGALAIADAQIIDAACHASGRRLKIVSFEAVPRRSYANCVDAEVVLEKSSLNPVTMIRKLRRCDLLVGITAGDSLSDLYGSRIFLVLMLLNVCALLSRRRMVFAPQTVGPFRNPVWRWAANGFMARLGVVFLRDARSRECLSPRVQARAITATDVAFTLPAVGTPARRGPSGRPLAGLNVSGLLYHDGLASSANSGADYRELCRDVVDCLVERGFDVVLVPHVIGDYGVGVDNDWTTAVDLCQADPRLTLSPRFENPVEAKAFISGLDFFVGSRMHATIAAVSSGVPTLALAYSRKFAGVFEPLGYTGTVDLNVASRSEVLDRLRGALSATDQLRREAVHAQETAEANLIVYEEFVADVVRRTK